MTGTECTGRRGKSRLLLVMTADAQPTLIISALCGGVNSPSVHRHLVTTGQLSPCQCVEQEQRLIKRVQPLCTYGED